MTYPSYRSTRGGNPSTPFHHALLQGLAPDGGLYIPESIPAIPTADWKEASDFPSLAHRVLTHWLGGEIASESLAALLRDALDFEVPLVPLNDDRWRDVYVLELFHGPTLSFKDFGARTMARLMGHFLKQQDRYLTVLVATSGDTGSAVADGFAGQPNIRVVLLYPHGQVSPTQERQLIVKRPGVTALAVDGSFDDCQRLVKDAFHDPGLETVELSSANSINIGRLLPQMLYYMEALRKGQFEPAFCVPSGNLGNLTGGLLARLSGLPVRRFIAAHNANDFFPCHLSEGLNSYRASVRTLSNAMDVGVPSNFERIRALLSPEEMRGMIKGYSISDEETIAGMRRVFEETGYLPDPHTAVGLVAAERYRRRSGDTSPVVVLSTAHPAKFPEVVDRALGFVPEAPPVLARLWKQDTSVTRIPPEASMLRDVILSSDVDTRLRNQAGH